MIEVALEPGETTQIELSIMVPEDAEAGSSDIAQVSAFGTTQPQFSKNFSAVTTMPSMPTIALDSAELNAVLQSIALSSGLEPGVELNIEIKVHLPLRVE